MITPVPPDHRVVRWFRAWRGQAGAGWRPSDALFRGAVGGLGLVTAGLVLHQPVVLLIGIPLLVSVVLGIGMSGHPVVSVRRRARSTEEGRDDLLAVAIESGRGAELVAVRMPAAGEGAGPVHLLAAGTKAVRVRLR
ncbi:MAG TPA: hypothetical protein VFT95_24055, partial [Micromonosporaceae bacterium]|nr:hypothetical protein [Micromonosporaceae bacterium]